VQERELSLIREFETKLLAREEENASTELQANATISNAITRLSYLFRQLLREHGGESLEPPSASDEAGVRDPWAVTSPAEHALDREIELERLQKENEELRRMLGLIPPQPRADNADMHGGFDARRPDAFQQRTGSVMMNSGFPSYQRIHSPG
jgi:hypothetical protein